MFRHTVLSAEESVMQAIQNKDLEALELTLQQYGRVNIDFLSSEGITPLMHVIILYAGTGGKGGVEMKLLQTLLQLQPDLSTPDSSEARTALHWAVVFDLRDLLIRLLEMGADYTLRDRAGMNPVHLAVEVNADNCLQTFLKYVSKEIFDLPDGLGRTCLIHAIQSEQSLRLSQKLINGGVSVNTQEQSKPFHSPLHTAALIDAKQITDLLLKAGADPTVVDDQGRIALHCAAMNPGGAVCPSLIKSTPATLLDLPDKQGLTPFLLTAKYAASKQMRLLMKRGVNTSARNVQGQTGFHLLAESSEGTETPLCLSQLRDKEPTLLDARDHAGHTPLTFAASVGNEVVLSELLAARADVSVIDDENHVPLHWAAAGRNPLCVRILTDYLRENGGDLDSRDNRMATPLHYAVQLAAFTSGSEQEEDTNTTRALECCHVLLQAGADPNAVDVSQSPPVLWAARYPHALAVIRLLQLSGAKIDIQNETGLSALHLAAQEGLVDTCRCLVEECAFPGSLIDNAGQTALFYALDHRHLECFQYLLSVGVYPDHQDLRDRSVAHLSCVHGLIDFLRVLKEHRANMDLHTTEGIRPAHEAVVNLQLECLRFLLVQCHCSPGTRDKSGASLLHYAADKGSVDMCRFLLESGADVNPLLSHREDVDKSVYYTPVDFARMKQHGEVVTYLEREGGKKGDEVADRASRKIQKVLRRVAERRRELEQTAATTATDTDLVSSDSEGNFMKEDQSTSQIDSVTSEGEDARDLALSPFHVPTPIREKRYLPGLHMISLATPPLKFTPAPQLSPHPLSPLTPPVTSDTLQQPAINARTLQKQLSVVQNARGVRVEEEDSKVSAVSFLAAGAVAVLSATLGGALGGVGLEAAGAVLQGELDEMRRDVQQQKETDRTPPLVVQQTDTRGTRVESPSVMREDKKTLDPILEHPDKEADLGGEKGRLKEMNQQFSDMTSRNVISEREHVRTREMRGKIRPETNKDICKDMERETDRKLVKLRTDSRRHDERFWREYELAMAEASEVGRELHRDIEMRRENNRELEELLSAYGVSRKPTVAQWLERKREQKRLELQRELIKWDSDKKQREAYVIAERRMSEERVARHSEWNQVKRLTLLNIREKQRLLDLQIGVGGSNDLFSRNFARNPYVYQTTSSGAVHSSPWTGLHSDVSPKRSQVRRAPATQPLFRSPRPPTKPRAVTRPVTIRMTERGLLRITDSSHLSSSPKKRNTTALDPIVANNPIWLRATGPKETPRSRPVIQLRPEEYVKLEKYRKNLASFPIPSAAFERSQLHRTLSVQSI